MVDRDRTLEIKRTQIEMVKGAKNSTVTGDFKEDLRGQMSLNVKQDINEKAGGTFLLQAGGDIHLKAGGRIVLEAAGGITFISAGGNSFIDCTDAGIVIQGPRVQVNCGLPVPERAQSAAPAPPDLPKLPDTLDLAGITNLPNLANPSATGPATAGGTSGASGASGAGGAAGGSAGLAANPFVSPSSLGTSPDTSSSAPLALTGEQIEGQA